MRTISRSSVLSSLILIALILFPVFVYAQVGNLQGLIVTVTKLVRMLIPIVAGLALLVFFYGVAVFVLKSGSDSAREEGRKLMLWGIIGLFVMMSVWGLVHFIGGAFGIGQGGVLY